MYKLFIKKLTVEVKKIFAYVFSWECVINALLVLLSVFVNDHYFMIKDTLSIMAYGYFSLLISNEIAEKIAPSNGTSSPRKRKIKHTLL